MTVPTETRMCETTILFVDLGGSAPVSASLGICDYDRFVKRLHETYSSILKTYKIDEGSPEEVVQNDLVPSGHYRVQGTRSSRGSGDSASTNSRRASRTR